MLLDDGTRVDASEFVRDYDEAFFGGDGLGALARVGQRSAAPARRGAAGRRASAAPLARPSKIVCIGLNFSDHAAESKMDLPKEPVIFFKATTAARRPGRPARHPARRRRSWTGKSSSPSSSAEARSYVDEARALDHVAGYALHNDYSERAFQLERGGQWVKGKSCDTFAPIGPFLATPDEIADPQALGMWLTVNGATRQKSTHGQHGLRRRARSSATSASS